MPSACTAVIRRRFSRSDMLAVSCASCACRWDSWRDFEADVGTVDKRLVAPEPLPPRVRDEVVDIVRINEVRPSRPHRGDERVHVFCQGVIVDAFRADFRCESWLGKVSRCKNACRAVSRDAIQRKVASPPSPPRGRYRHGYCFQDATTHLGHIRGGDHCHWGMVRSRFENRPRSQEGMHPLNTQPCRTTERLPQSHHGHIRDWHASDLEGNNLTIPFRTTRRLHHFQWSRESSSLKTLVQGFSNRSRSSNGNSTPSS